MSNPFQNSEENISAFTVLLVDVLLILSFVAAMWAMWGPL